MSHNDNDHATTALLLLDPYNDFLSDGGKLWPYAKDHESQCGPINPTVDVLDGVRGYPTLLAYAAERGAPDVVNVFRKSSEASPVAREASRPKHELFRSSPVSSTMKRSQSRIPAV